MARLGGGLSEMMGTFSDRTGARKDGAIAGTPAPFVVYLSVLGGRWPYRVS
jgi:hypothetical protein